MTDPVIPPFTKAGAIAITIVQAFLMSYIVWCEIANFIHPGPMWRGMELRDWYAAFGLTLLVWVGATTGVWVLYFQEKKARA